MLNCIDKQKDISREKHIIYQRTALVIGPVLTAYVHWILEKSLDGHIQTLFFLARDGQILKEIAEIFIMSYQLPIQCRYLYVSRYSLRKALFCINKEESFEFLGCNSIRITPEILLNRTGLSSVQQNEILKAMQYYEPCKRSKDLSAHELKSFLVQLRKNTLFEESMEQMSKIENDKIFRYFVQEQITSSESIAIVDCGWTGSMQRTIRQILEAHHIKCKIEGF